MFKVQGQILYDFLESNENDIADKDVVNFDVIVKLKACVDKMQYICIYI